MTTDGEPQAVDERLDRQQRLVRSLGLVALVAAGLALWAAMQLRAESQRGSGDGDGLVGAGLTRSDDGSGLSGWTATEPQPAPDFTLTRTDGKPFSLSELSGRVALVFFGYTNCPDVCPQTLTWLGQALQDMPPETRVTVVFITVDPDRDSPEVIEAYLAGYDERIVGLTGSVSQLEKVVASYNSTFFKQVVEHEHAPGTPTEHAHDDYTMAHPSEVYVVDPQGALREFISLPFAPDDVRHDVELLLEESVG
jgi:protein SCO1/2